MALKNLTQNDLNWIANEYQNGRSIQEIAVDTGMSTQNARRALAEVGLLNLTWYKTKNEIAILEYLNEQGIHTLSELYNFIEDVV